MNATVQSLTVQVADVRAEAQDAITLELRAVGGGELPPFEPGAHLDLHLPNGLVRQYSLTNDWRERNRYVIGVGRAADSRGGSSYVHSNHPRRRPAQDQRASQQLRARREFASFLFIAGGIGDHADHGDGPLVRREREAVAPDLRRAKPPARGILRRPCARSGPGSRPFPLR